VRRFAVWVIILLGLACFSFGQEHKATGEGKQEAAEQDMTGWKWANFAILAAGIAFLLIKQAGPYFAGRSAEIRKQIAEAEKLRATAEARAAAIDAKLANLGAEVEAMRSTAKQEAAKEGERIQQETEREIAKIQAHAEMEIASALKTAQIDLKAYSGQLAINLARNKIRERITPADQDALVQNFVSGLASPNLTGPALEQSTTQ
jgi:F-type H+-transporting ATPase subunit b